MVYRNNQSRCLLLNTKQLIEMKDIHTAIDFVDSFFFILISFTDD